ncbi:hypothetical protein FGO68_gene2389 [Halteria grandinella]|uniref:Uncharacterized protein n=1 Tax=Halteria grandinella TaxID=5974 RepID=A0A8J8P4L9_HALGN|nr:hypothetical protein FGO68_gene2389 [Halteria grandinella]
MFHSFQVQSICDAEELISPLIFVELILILVQKVCQEKGEDKCQEQEGEGNCCQQLTRELIAYLRYINLMKFQLLLFGC